MAAANEVGTDDESVLSEELSVLESIYITELSVQKDENGCPKTISVLLHPATGEDESKKYVCMTLDFTVPDNYPEEIPEIHVRNPRGLGEEELQSLIKDMKVLAEDRKGGAMLFELIEMAKDCLTEGNLPHCECAICLEHFEEGNPFIKTDCYHYFHRSCLARYAAAFLAKMQDKEPTAMHTTDKGEEKVLGCPMCRLPLTCDLAQLLAEPVPPEEVIQFTPTPDLVAKQAAMAERYEQQKAKGGIIDLEEEKNKFLVSEDTVVSLENIRKQPQTLPDGTADDSDQPADKGKNWRHNGARSAGAGGAGRGSHLDNIVKAYSSPHPNKDYYSYVNNRQRNPRNSYSRNEGRRGDNRDEGVKKGFHDNREQGVRRGFHDNREEGMKRSYHDNREQGVKRGFHDNRHGRDRRDRRPGDYSKSETSHVHRERPGTRQREQGGREDGGKSSSADHDDTHHHRVENSVSVSEDAHAKTSTGHLEGDADVQARESAGKDRQDANDSGEHVEGDNQAAERPHSSAHPDHDAGTHYDTDGGRCRSAGSPLRDKAARSLYHTGKGHTGGPYHQERGFGRPHTTGPAKHTRSKKHPIKHNHAHEKSHGRDGEERKFDKEDAASEAHDHDSQDMGTQTARTSQPPLRRLNSQDSDHQENGVEKKHRPHTTAARPHKKPTSPRQGEQRHDESGMHNSYSKKEGRSGRPRLHRNNSKGSDEHDGESLQQHHPQIKVTGTQRHAERQGHMDHVGSGRDNKEGDRSRKAPDMNNAVKDEAPRDERRRSVDQEVSDNDKIDTKQAGQTKKHGYHGNHGRDKVNWAHNWSQHVREEKRARGQRGGAARGAGRGRLQGQTAVREEDWDAEIEAAKADNRKVDVDGRPEPFEHRHATASTDKQNSHENHVGNSPWCKDKQRAPPGFKIGPPPGFDRKTVQTLGAPPGFT